MDKILLIDGYNAIYRANVKFGSKTAIDKPDYTIIYNFFRNLRATIAELSPNKIFFCLEGSNNFRYKLYSEYKANRIIKTAANKKTPENFNDQAKIIIELLSLLPITLVVADNYEADDVIGTLTENLKDEEVIILSNDTDYIQLLQKDYQNLKIFNPFKKEYVVAPEYHLLTFKCLAGDTSDNIPGLVSEEEAIILASQSKKLLKFLFNEENRANYVLNKQLIELKIIPDEELIFTDYNINYNKLKNNFDLMEFKSFNDKYWETFVETFEELK